MRYVCNRLQPLWTADQTAERKLTLNRRRYRPTCFDDRSICYYDNPHVTRPGDRRSSCHSLQGGVNIRARCGRRFSTNSEKRNHLDNVFSPLLSGATRHAGGWRSRIGVWKRFFLPNCPETALPLLQSMVYPPKAQRSKYRSQTHFTLGSHITFRRIDFWRLLDALTTRSLHRPT